MDKEYYLTETARQANEIAGTKGNKLEKYLPEIGRRCRNIRKMMELTQEDIAAAVGVTHAAVSQFENGKAASFWLLVYYVSALHVGLKDLGDKMLWQ